MAFSDKYFKKADKIWPIKKAFPILSFFVVLIISLGILSHFIEKRNRKREMFTFEINGIIEKRINAKNYCFYKINEKWYGVQGEINIELQEKDSIKKQAEAEMIEIIKNKNKTILINISEAYFIDVNKDKQLLELLKRNIIE